MATRKAQPETDETTGDDDDERESIVETVRSVLGETLGSLFESGKADVVDTAEKKDTPKAEKSLTLRDVEETAARMIREAQDAIKPKGKKAEDEPAPEKKAPAPEAPPERRNWLRDFFWGKE